MFVWNKKYIFITIVLVHLEETNKDKMALISIKNSKVFKYIVILTALTLALTSGYYSVVGFASISGGDISVMIMASILEISKIVTVSLLYRYWNDLSKMLKYYLTVGVIILMMFTSTGIYGYLTNTFQKTQNELSIVDINKNKSQLKIDQFTSSLSTLEEQINNKNKRIQLLQEQRQEQENRVSQLYTSKNYYSARKATQLIENSDKQIIQLQQEVDDIVKNKFNIQDSVNYYKNEIANIDINSNISGEVGSLQYLSLLLNVPLNVVFNYYILLVIIVFDPLALALILTGNFISEYQLKSPEKEEKTQEIALKTIENTEKTPKNSRKTMKNGKNTQEKEEKPIETNSNNTNDIPEEVINIYNEKEKNVGQDENKQYINNTVIFEDGEKSDQIVRVENTNKRKSYGNINTP